MILLDEIIQVFARPDLRLWAQHSARPEFCDSRVSSRVAIERNPLGSTVPFDCSYKESFGRCNISMFTQQEIDRESLPIDSAVEVCPSPSDLNICFVHSPLSAGGPSIATPAFLELRYEALNPSQDSSVGDIHAALGHHLDQVAIAELIGDVPSDTENNDRVVEVAATK
jgi:hypothetical protein